MHQLSEIKDLSGEKLTFNQVLRELGDFRGKIPSEQIALIEPISWKLERLSTEGRDKTGKALSLIDSLGYFDSNLNFTQLMSNYPSLHSKDVFNSFSEKLDAYLQISSSTFWKRVLVQVAVAQDSPASNVKILDEFLGQANAYVANSHYFSLLNINRLLVLSPALLSRKEFQVQLRLGFLASYFKQKKMKKEIFLALSNHFSGSSAELYSKIQEHSKFLAIVQRSEESFAALEYVIDNLDNINEQISTISSASKFLRNSLKDSASPLTSDFDNDLPILKSLGANKGKLEKLPLISGALKEIADHKVSPVLESFENYEFDGGEIERLWNYAWLSAKLEQEIARNDDLITRANELDSSIQVFADLDGQHLAGNAGKILTVLSSRAAQIPADDARTLAQEARKTRAWKPFRKLLQEMPNSIQILKPVMAMSPLAVSQLLPCHAGMFDIVIFDEASQIRPHDAVTAIYRGKQVVIAGDRFQLPPTEFGEKVIEDEYRESENEEVPEAATFGMESILTSAIAIFNKNVKPLGLHYRSHDEKLISWSNFNIYRNAGEELFTFPSNNTESSEILKYSYLSGVRIAGMQDPNYAEIEAVKAAILKHIQTTPHLTLGVIAFGMRHSIRLQDALNILERESDIFYQWKSKWVDKGDLFFVKNIERVQGDERDAIIITPGYAPGLDGVMPLQFGTLNRQGGERRLNVAASRAKEYMHLITSMRSTDIELKRTKSVSIGLLKSFLDFMENHGRITESEVGFNTSTTPFEAEIQQALEARGLIVVPGWGFGI